MGWVERMYVCMRVESQGQHVSSGVTLKDAICLLESRSFKGLEFTH